MRHVIPTTIAATLIALVLAVPAARAQGTAVGSIYDPSIRAAGMGGGASAVFWGGDLNTWANPALLGYAQGLRFEHGRSRLVPGLAADVLFDTERITIGGGGVGVALGGLPGGLGKTDLEYGLSTIVDPEGNPLGVAPSYERVESWGVGVSAAGLARTIAAWRGTVAPALAAYADLAFGVTQKELKVELAPFSVARSKEHDWGALARVTPIDNARRGATPGLPFRLDLAYGFSILNAADAMVTFTNEDVAAPVSRVYFNGFAARGEMGLPAGLRSRFGRAAWLAESFEPLLSLGGNWDFEHVQAGSEAKSGYDARHVGGEVSIANIVSLRAGHLEDKLGDISGGTWGWGLGFHLGRYGGWRYDYGTRPQSADLPDVKRRGWTAFIDVAALARLSNPS